MQKNKTLFLEIPTIFDFRQTVLSHGWCQLLPFEFDAEKLSLSYVFRNSDKSASATISESAGKLEIEISDGEINEVQILRDVRHILRLDDDLSDFYQLTKKEFAWISETISRADSFNQIFKNRR